MTTIKASCPTCNDVELTDQDVELVVCRIPALGYYAFSCPSCRQRVEKPIDDNIVSLLLSGGVHQQELHVPLELDEIQQMSGPTITLDDVIELHDELSLLDDPDWAQLLTNWRAQ